MVANQAFIDGFAWAKSHFSKWELRDLYAVQYASRAQSGFQFLSDILHPDYFLRHEATSAPVSRQMFILISYNFELLLDAAVCICSIKNSENDLKREINVTHNLSTLWGRVTNKEIRNLMQIDRIKSPKEGASFPYFEILLRNNKIIKIPEFRNVRYDIADFRGREREVLRPAQKEEETMDNAIQTFSEAAKSITSRLYSKYK